MDLKKSEEPIIENKRDNQKETVRSNGRKKEEDKQRRSRIMVCKGLASSTSTYFVSTKFSKSFSMHEEVGQKQQRS
jgi:hypothetical protein